MPGIQKGAPAPDFELVDDAGKPVRLSSVRGKPVVLFFYPEADTPGCTQQARGFRDVHARFERAGAVVLGVSPDAPRANAAFREKYGFPFRLLSDPGNKVAARYGAYGEKQMYGNTVVGTIRSSIVIDAQGSVASIHRNVRTEGNGARMVEQVEKLARAR